MQHSECMPTIKRVKERRHRMSEAIDTFKRVEDKYRITFEQMESLLAAWSDHMHKDVYYRYRVHSVYYDSENCDLIVHGLQKTGYKMKLRLRCYGQPGSNKPVFLETKKKLGDIVYKKRLQLSEREAYDYLDYGIMHHVHNNTAGEIDYMMNYYNLKPKVLIAYDRECYAADREEDVRITFDTNIRYRIDDPDLSENGTEEELAPGMIMMEIKAMDRYPMWIVKELSAMKLYRTSFSKYGKIYAENMNEMNPVSQTYALQPETAEYEKEKKICSLQF